MKINRLYWTLAAASISIFACTMRSAAQEKLLLRNGWVIQSSKEIRENGAVISTSAYQPEKWYPASVPSTVFGTLVENKVFPDPYYGTNIENIPGYISRRGAEIPEDSPFKYSWWYRTVFTLEGNSKDRNIWLSFHSINYKANIWLNGKLVADTTEIKGAYRLYNLNVTGTAISGKENCLAIEIFPPKGNDLTITWVDWNPTPPDKGMGIWYDVSVHFTGPIAVDKPWVRTKLNLPAADKANLTVSAEVTNTTNKEIKGVLKGRIENISFSQELTLGPKENRQVTFNPEKFSQLVISDPKLWWPYTVGPQNLYDLTLDFEVKGKVTDSEKIRFGIREITSWMNNFDGKHTRVFQVNGKNIVIRGGGYVEDMMLRPSDKRIDTDIQYAKHMGLNALRMEAPRGSDYIFEKCDEEGILLMVGWCCCSSWEQWKKWTPDIEIIAQKSWMDQIVRLRNHPSVFDWLYGSDNFPPANIEKMYIQVLNDLDGTRPYQSSATKDSSAIAGNTGLWMGPYPKVYAYEPPVYWYGKLEFNTEAGPSGEQIPPVESMRKMMPDKDLWPMSHSWDIRLHKAFYPEARKALYSRYGKPEGLDEYSMKSQVLQYEATRAMFEAFAANKYKSSGIIYWMYNSAWPKMYWQLYDYFFAPNGSFYGTKKACELLHIQYSYDDKSIRVVNGIYKDFTGLKATAKLYNLNMEIKYSKETAFDIKADESKKVILPEWPNDAGEVFFLKLLLTDNNGKEVSSNFYWLSSKGDENADFTALNTLPEVSLNYSVISVKKENGRYIAEINIENPGPSLAFSVNPKIINSNSKDLVLPVFWEDNYFSLLPKEKRSVKAVFAAENLNGAIPVLVIAGWNIKPAEKELK
jgi:exo-1,4-beta-D-glucosaminidase